MAILDEMCLSIKIAAKAELATRLSAAAEQDPDALPRHVAEAVASLSGGRVSEAEQATIIESIVNDYMHLGPLTDLMGDDEITEVMVNGGGYDEHGREMTAPIYVERHGELELVRDARFDDEAHIRQIIERIASRCGRVVNEESPILDARLPDGSRVHATLPPVAVDGPSLNIRRFRRDITGMDQMIANGTLTAPMAEFLNNCVYARCNVLVTGGTGSGKTTMLNALSAYIPERERIIVIEDTSELQLQQAHVERREARRPNAEGAGEVTIRDLVVGALRERPDRIIVGECRRDETLEMLQAMQTGHDGSLTTVHANNPAGAFNRIETMVLGSETLPSAAIRQQIAEAIDLIVHTERCRDGRRRVTAVECVTGMEGDTICHDRLFEFEKLGVAEDGSVRGRFRGCGALPSGRVRDKLAAAGAQMEREWFFGEQGGGQWELR